MQTENNPGNTKLCLRLRMLNNGIQRYVESHSECKDKSDNLSYSGVRIIGYLYHEEQEGNDVFPKDLENEFGITRSTVSKVLSGLERKGLISRKDVFHDARLKKIVLTEKAKKVALAFREDDERIESLMIKGFSSEELKSLCEYLERIRQNLEKADN